MKRTLLLLLFLMLTQVGWSQQYVNSNYGRDIHEWPVKCLVQPDSTVLILGRDTYHDYILYKIKPGGDTVFTKYEKGRNFIYGYGTDLIVFPNGDVVIPGDAGGIVKFDIHGNRVWAINTGGFLQHRFKAGARVSDTSFVVVGSKEIFSHMQMVPDLGLDSVFIPRVYVALYHVSGKLLNEKVIIYGSDTHEGASSIIYTSSGTLLINGSYYRYEPGNWTDNFLLTLAPDLSVISDTVYPRTANFGKPKMENSRGNFMNCGSKTVHAANDNDVFLQELNSNGDILWEKTYDLKGDDYGMAMLESEGYYFVTGGTGNKKNVVPEYADIVLLKLDLQGDTIWTKTYTLPAGQGAVDMKDLNDSMLVILGSTNYKTPCPPIMNPGYICADFYVMYVNKETGYSNLYPQKPQPILSKEVVVYPNPSNGIVKIKGEGIKSVIVTNSVGKVIKTRQHNEAGQEVEISGLEKGIYFLLVETEKGFEKKRVVIM